MKKSMQYIVDGAIAAGVLVLGCASYWFLRLNTPIIKHDIAFAVALAVNLLLILAALLYNRAKTSNGLAAVNFIVTTAYAAFVAYVMINAVFYDSFQPLVQYDRVVRLAMAGFILTGVALAFQGDFILFWNQKQTILIKYIGVSVLLTVFIMQFYVLAWTQKDFDYTNISSKPIDLFETEETGYDSFKMPALLVIHAGETLANGERLKEDRVVAFAEASPGQSGEKRDTDLVLKISTNGAESWSGLAVIDSWTDGKGKIGNATPVFDRDTGELFLFHIGDPLTRWYKGYMMKSMDGGENWESAKFILRGIVGPGHGIQIDGGKNDGRLIVPIQGETARILYSDDHGETWVIGAGTDDGNENEAVQIDETGTLMMVVRTNTASTSAHEPLYKQYAVSLDGGETWSDTEDMTGIKDPICMSSIVSDGETLYYAYPDDFYSRARMTVVSSYDGGDSWVNADLIYAGPSGYSDLGVLSDGRLLLLFENGAVEYDERITLAVIDPKKK